MTPDTKAFLGGLPFRIDIKPFGGHVAGPTIMLFHATPVNNLVYVTEDRTDGFLSKMAQQAGAKPGDVICFGHTHKPWHRVVEGIHFVNTGSVGRPKDGDPRACYVILDMSGAAPVLGFARVEYDVERAAEGIRENGLPIEFAAHLPMKGATMVATLERLGVLASYSRPSVNNDNAYSESLFRTLKFCPAYPAQPFADRAASARWKG